MYVYRCVCVHIYVHLHVPEALPRLEAWDSACRGHIPTETWQNSKADMLRHGGGSPICGIDRRLNCGVHRADLRSWRQPLSTWMALKLCMYFGKGVYPFLGPSSLFLCWGLPGRSL